MPAAEPTTVGRPLGRSGILVGPVGLGCVTFGREIDEEASRRILDAAVERGMSLLDTAEAYGGGNARLYRREHYRQDDAREVGGEMHSSEKILGRWLRDRGSRKDVVLCTKVSSGNAPENVRLRLGQSLERLKADFVDIYMLHKPDPQVPITETLAALNEEASAGRVRTLGCSNFSAAQLREALSVSEAKGWRRFEVVEPPYSLVAREAEPELFPLCREAQIGVAAYSPLAAGFLSGKYTPDRTRIPAGSRFDVAPGHADLYFQEDNFQLVGRLRQKAESLGMPMVRLAVWWAMMHPDVTTVLVGARSVDHLDSALSAASLPADARLRDELSGLIPLSSAGGVS
ncbi:MAG: aldo/keto reductase [Pirellulales bacterium]|nr:aldo/keto reductase [Pirellulales bacterium]